MLATDFIAAARALLRRRTFAALTLMLVALAATATGATFAIARATLWRELPYADPGALVQLYTREPVTRDSAQEVIASALMLARWRERASVFTGIEGYTPVNLSVSSTGEAESLQGAAVSAGLFDLLGTPPAVGRDFLPEEERPASGVIIVSDAVARRRFGSVSAALGQTLVVDGTPNVIVGIMPPRYSLLFQGGDAWIPMDLSADQLARTNSRAIVTFGRLRAGISQEQGLSELKTSQSDVAAEAPTVYGATQVGLRSIRDGLFGNRKPTIAVLSMAVALVLLIAILNVSSLFIADVLSRRTLTMTRVALGARSRDIAHARLAELVVLAGFGVLTTVPLTGALLAGLAWMNPDAFIPLSAGAMDVAVVVATALTVLIAVFAGGAPALVLESRTDASGIAGAVAKATGTLRDRRLQRALGAGQAAVTVVLLGIAALLGRDLAAVMSAPTGLSTHGVVVVRMNVASRERTTVPARAQYADELGRKVSDVPGVTDVSAIQSRFILNETMQSAFEVEGFVPPVPNQRIFSQIRHVMPNVFRVLGVRVVSGRGIDSTDRADSRPVVVVNRALAQAYWPGEEAVGKRIRRGAPGSPWLDVVGVVEDVMDAGLGVPLGPTFYVSYLQQNTPTARVTLVARVGALTPGVVEGVRRAIWSVNPGQAIDDVTPLNTLMRATAAQPQFRALVVGAFGISAIALVLAGVYATTLFGVLARRREFGIRAAIGASPGRLSLIAARAGLNPVLAGGIAGAVLTIPAAQLTSGIIQSRMSSGDILLSFGAVVLLVGVSAIAALIPARRAARVSPTEAMRAG
jgi:predicted permease